MEDNSKFPFCDMFRPGYATMEEKNTKYKKYKLTKSYIKTTWNK